MGSGFRIKFRSWEEASLYKPLNNFQLSQFHMIMPAQLCKAGCQREFAVSVDCILHLLHQAMLTENVVIFFKKLSQEGFNH